jgi:hypothetical protein
MGPSELMNEPIIDSVLQLEEVMKALLQKSLYAVWTEPFMPF